MADMTPAAWLSLLNERIDTRWGRWQRLDSYFNGNHPLAFSTTRYREAFGALLQAMADNWCQVVVESSADRLKVQGFRFGDQHGADDEAWAIWQANGLDAEASMAHVEAIKLGESYWLVDPTQRVGDDQPRITAEHPSQMIVACAAGDRRKRLAALKKWRDDDNYVYATLYLPDFIYKFRSQEKMRGGGGSRVQWMRRPGDEGARNPLGLVPVVPLRNNPSMLGGGQSDLIVGIPLQDAINKLCGDMIVASEYAAYRQRVMTGVEQPVDPDTGKPLKIEMGVSRLLTVEAADAKVFDLAASDLKNYVDAIEMLIQHLAAQTRTPPHYLMGSIVNASGDALKVAETGLVSKVREKMVTLGEGHEDAMRLAFLAKGETVKAEAMDAETIWKDPESRSFGMLVDGLLKLRDLQVPNEILWERAQFSPQEIARMQTMQTAQDLLAPPPPPPIASTGGAAAGRGNTGIDIGGG